MINSSVYDLQNAAIHSARSQLEAKGILTAGEGLEQIRDIAAELNAGIRSIRALSLEQRRALIDILNRKGANVRNPGVYESDLKTEAEKLGKRRKVVKISALGEKRERLVDTLAAEIAWPNFDSFAKLCAHRFGAPWPRNAKEARQIVAILKSMIEKQERQAAAERGEELPAQKKPRRRKPREKAKNYPAYRFTHTDARGVERTFTFSVAGEVRGVVYVTAREQRPEGDKGGYRFEAGAPAVEQAFAHLKQKVIDGLGKTWTHMRLGEISFDHMLKGRVSYRGVVIDGEFIGSDNFMRMLDCLEGSAFTLTIDDE